MKPLYAAIIGSMSLVGALAPSNAYSQPSADDRQLVQTVCDAVEKLPKKTLQFGYDATSVNVQVFRAEPHRSILVSYPISEGGKNYTQAVMDYQCNGIYASTQLDMAQMSGDALMIRTEKGMLAKPVEIETANALHQEYKGIVKKAHEELVRSNKVN